MNLRFDPSLRIRMSQLEYETLKEKRLSDRFRCMDFLSLLVQVQLNSESDQSFLETKPGHLDIYLSRQDYDCLSQKEFFKNGIFIGQVNIQINLLGDRHGK